MKGYKAVRTTEVVATVCERATILGYVLPIHSMLFFPYKHLETYPRQINAYKVSSAVV